ncbi:Multidrug resistance-associated protein 7, partial [Stegodyphus mimosarum]
MGMLKNKSCILCTHKMQFTEKADHLIILSNGKVVSQGSPNKILPMYFLNSKEDDQDDKVNSETSKTADEYDDDDTVAEEEKEKGVVKFHVYKSYWKAIGTPLSLSVLLFCLLMQTSRTTSDWWLSYWVSSIHSTGNH